MSKLLFILCILPLFFCQDSGADELRRQINEINANIENLQNLKGPSLALIEIKTVYAEALKLKAIRDEKVKM